MVRFHKDPYGMAILSTFVLGVGIYLISLMPTPYAHVGFGILYFCFLGYMFLALYQVFLFHKKEKRKAEERKAKVSS